MTGTYALIHPLTLSLTYSLTLSIESLKGTNKVIVLKEAPKFSNNAMNGPVFVEISPPSYLHDSDKKILLPKQRRYILTRSYLLTHSLTKSFA